MLDQIALAGYATALEREKRKLDIEAKSFVF
jgi:hypothetical protein